MSGWSWAPSPTIWTAACFDRHGLAFAPGAFRSGVRARAKLPRTLRRVSKTAEYLANLASLWRRAPATRFDPCSVSAAASLRVCAANCASCESLQRKGVKVVYTVHNVLPHDLSPRLRTHYAQIYDLADHLICHDPSARLKLIQDFGQSPGPNLRDRAWPAAYRRAALRG